MSFEPAGEDRTACSRFVKEAVVSNVHHIGGAFEINDITRTPKPPGICGFLPMTQSVFLEFSRTDDSKSLSKNDGTDRLNGGNEQTTCEDILDLFLRGHGAGTSTLNSSDRTGRATAAACCQKFIALETAHIAAAGDMIAPGDTKYLGRRH